MTLMLVFDWSGLKADRDFPLEWNSISDAKAVQQSQHGAAAITTAVLTPLSDTLGSLRFRLESSSMSAEITGVWRRAVSSD